MPLPLRVTLLAMVLWGCSRSPDTGAEPRSLELVDWEYRWADAASRREVTERPLDSGTASDWKSIRVPARPPRVPGASLLLMQARLPDRRLYDPTLSFDAIVGDFDVWLEDRQIYAYPGPEPFRQPGLHGFASHRARLPADYAGRSVLIRIWAEQPQAGMRGVPRLSERADEIEYIVRRDAGRAAVGVLLLLLGVLVPVPMLRGPSRRLAIGFCLFATSAGIYCLHYTALRDLVVFAPTVWFLAWAAAVPLGVIGMLLFVRELFGPGPRGVVTRLLRANLVVAAILAVVYLAGIAILELWPDGAARRGAVSAYVLATTAHRALAGASGITLLGVFGRLALRRDRDGQIFLAGAAVLIASGLHAIAAALGVGRATWSSQLHVGWLAMTLALVLLLERHFAATQRREARYALELEYKTREKERLLRDLHDGIGSLTSNIRMLAEAARDDHSRAENSLDTIAELAGEGLLELRAFVQSLDDASTTYASLAVELRRFAAQLVEAHGRTLHAQVEVTIDARPGSLLCLNALRVLREGLTNALRHGGSGPIDLSLRADSRQFELRIENSPADAAPGPDAGIGSGRGLANLRARAAELGGTLEIELAERVRLLLSVPIPQKPPEPLRA